MLVGYHYGTRLAETSLINLCFMYCHEQVHKKLGNTHLALMNFSWAMDLDPKGANNHIKEAIDKRYVTDDEETGAGQLDVFCVIVCCSFMSSAS